MVYRRTVAFGSYLCRFCQKQVSSPVFPARGFSAFVTGIYSDDPYQNRVEIDLNSSFYAPALIGALVYFLAGIIGNYVGYWFGRKSGPFLFERKDTFFFKKKYLLPD